MNYLKFNLRKIARQLSQQMASLAILTIILACASSALMGQNTRIVAGKHYIKYNNIWYLQDFATQDTFRVDTTTIIIKYAYGTTTGNISNFVSTQQLSEIRHNELGFFDYLIPANANIFDLVEFNIAPSPFVEIVEINTFGRFGLIPNDPAWGTQFQWHLDQASNADINAEKTWDITTGCPNISVAVIDAGADFFHEELGFGTDNYQNIYINYNEDPWVNGLGNGIDDDGNGYVDDRQGWDFYQGDKDAQASFVQDHGTSVSGFVAGKTNNNKGFSGIAGGWHSPGTSLMELRIGDLFPNPAVIDDAILYAAKQGAKIIQLSLTVTPSAAIDAALQVAYQTYGVFIVCASGNGNGQPVLYPANNQYVFSVGATDINDLKASFSSFGPALDLSAPGEGLSTINNFNSYCAYCGNGTSFAAPLVSGVASLMLCVNPCLTNKQLEDILKNTADKVGGYNYSYDPNKPGHSLELGYGRLDALKAVIAAKQMFVTAPTVDLYTKDQPNDWGGEPSANTGPMWVSDDIWVRNQNDGFVNQVHENPEYNINPALFNYVYVRVRNKSCVPSLGTEQLKLYWAKAASALSWQSYWDGTQFCNGGPSMGDIISIQTIPVIPPGGDIILEFPWHSPFPDDYNNCNPEPWHFCLLSRIVAANDPMTFVEVPSVYDNAKNNNNIAWKNVTVVNYLPGIVSNGECLNDRVAGGTIAIGNPFSDKEDNYKLEFKLDEKNRGVPIQEQAEIKLTLDDLSWQKWAQGGYQATNIRVKREDCHQLVITGNPAYLHNLNYMPNERSTIHVSFNFLTEKVDAIKLFDYHVIQYRSQDDKIIGGELYHIQKPTRNLFGADAGTDKNISEGTAVTLSGNSIGETALYNWYDPSGELIYSGKDFNVSPAITTKYKLEIIAAADGFASYDEINVKVKDNEIKTISPNPATNQIAVEYKLTNPTSAYIVITNLPATINDNYILSINQTTTTINVSNYAAGNYNLILVVNGEVKDQKNLSIQ